MIIKPGIFDHPKTVMLENLTAWPLSIIGLMRIWLFCEQQRAWRFQWRKPAQFLHATAKAPVELTADAWMEALEASSWIHLHEDGSIEVHGWGEYNSNLIRNWNNGLKHQKRVIDEAGWGVKSLCNDEPEFSLAADPEPIDQATPRHGHSHDGAIRLDKIVKTSTPKAPKGAQSVLGTDLTDLHRRVGAIHKRKPNSRWTAKELKAFKEAEVTEESVDLMERFYKFRDSYKEGSGPYLWKNALITHLNNWAQQEDRAKFFLGQRRGHATPTDEPPGMGGFASL